ncbi:MAG: hypothetical protein IJE76_07645 [Bacteroidales bacterium]|nr:hypothetical protein [Bacteroidales bacterium]
MNKTFDIKRFGNVLRHDAMSYLQNFGWTLVVLLAIPILIWSILYINMDDTEAVVNYERYGFLLVLAIIAMILAPSRLYKNANDSRKGIQFAMLPASNMEKFLSMTFYCLLATPVLYLVGAVAIDSILAIIPGNNPYGGFVFRDIFHTNIVMVELTDDLYLLPLPFYQVFLLLSYVSIFMFTNMIFKRRKVSKTIGILALIGIIFMVIFIKVMLYYENIYEYDMIPDDTQEILARWAYYGYYVFNIILTVAMLYLTYYKIRKQKY